MKKFKKNLKNYVVAAGLVLCMLFSLLPDMRVSAEGAKTYKVMVNRAANCVTVYEKDAEGNYTVPVRAFVCSVGRAGHATPLGTFKTSDYYTWRMMVDGSYGQYAVRFYKGIMFHSVPYYTRNAGNMEWEQYNLLGEPASLGCVRLAWADAKWIYENCARGTEVVVYDDAENAGPLGKPTEMKLAAEHPFKTWDPTNYDAESPWNAIRPGIKFLDDRGDGVVYLPVGSTKEELYGKLAVCNNEGAVYQPHEYQMEIIGSYDLNRTGAYVLRVQGTDFLGTRTWKDIILCVHDPIM